MDAPGLTRDWITRPAIDAELKRYILLAYLQRVRGHFDHLRLFPHLEEVGEHAAALAALGTGMEGLRMALSREAAGFDPSTGEVVKVPLETELDSLRVIEDVIGFALPELNGAVRDGNDRLEEAWSAARFEPVGVLPLDLREGYLLLRERNEAHAYAYSFTVFRSSTEHDQHRSVRTSYIGPYVVSVSNTYEAIKADLTRSRRELPAPAMFAFEAVKPLPRIETCLPLARRLVWRVISVAA